MATSSATMERSARDRPRSPQKSTFVMATILLVLGFWLIYPVILILIQSFNVRPDVLVGSPIWGLDNWRVAFSEPRLMVALGNTFMIWTLTMVVSFPTAVMIAWILARTNIPFSHGLEFMFWVSFFLPSISTTIAWIIMLDPSLGIVNVLVRNLPFVDQGPFNIFSVPGIIWAQLMANGVALKVMLLTPAFRNMDSTLEEAARVSGASDLRTMFRITLPMMVSPMVLVFALQLLRIFQSFEIELLLGVPFGFFVYSTMIFDLVRQESPPQYGQATALASMTLLVIAIIIPLQRWILHRRQYTTITGTFKPGLINLGKWKWPVLSAVLTLIVLLTLLPAAALVLGSFMTRSGFFNIDPTFTMRHWNLVLGDRLFMNALRTTLVLAMASAILSPLLFSVIAYILVRTRWAGRLFLDLIIWGSGAIPGMLAGLGLLWLFLGDFPPGTGMRPLIFMFGTIYALLIVVIIQGNTTGVNIFKGVLVQVGRDMEEAARVAGAGWIRTYFRVWIPLLMPTMVLIGTINFVVAANTTSSIILIADRTTRTLSILALEFASPGIGQREAASVIGIILILLTVGVASVARAFGIRVGVRHERSARALPAQQQTNVVTAPTGR